MYSGLEAFAFLLLLICEMGTELAATHQTARPDTWHLVRAQKTLPTMMLPALRMVVMLLWRQQTGVIRGHTWGLGATGKASQSSSLPRRTTLRLQESGA